MCGDLLIYIPLFIESILEVPLKKEKKRKKGKKRKGLIYCVCFFSSIVGGALRLL
jgi:hypothetical protein